MQYDTIMYVSDILRFGSKEEARKMVTEYKVA